MFTFFILLAVAPLVMAGQLLASYKAHFSKLDARRAALVEASHGAAMIALAVLAYLRMGRILPVWFPLAALAVVIWGALRLFNGAKFSVGWRDPKLITGALVKTGVGVAIYQLVWNPAAWVSRDLAASIAGFLYATAPYGAWATSAVVLWCVVTGLTKLLLVLRGFPAGPWVDPGMPHGTAGFSGPDDPGWKL
jgi:hypothetical protein